MLNGNKCIGEWGEERGKKARKGMGSWRQWRVRSSRWEVGERCSAKVALRQGGKEVSAVLLH